MGVEIEEDDEGGGGEAAWMATFADLSTLLLTFFVLLLSFANVDVVQFRMALGSVKDALGVQFEHPGDISGMTTSPLELSKRESTAAIVLLDEVQLLERIKKAIKKKGLEGKVKADLGDRGVFVRIKGQLLFDVGDAKLRARGDSPLASVAELATAIPFPISIEGHTDDRPIRTSKYPSNWELSTARATAAMRYLVDAGVDPARLGVAGYAHMRPLVANDTRANRARNRRVEFVFVSPVDKKQKNFGGVLDAVERLNDKDGLEATVSAPTSVHDKSATLKGPADQPVADEAGAPPESKQPPPTSNPGAARPPPANPVE